LLKKKQALDHNGRSVKAVSAIPTARMDAYVAEMQRRLATGLLYLRVLSEFAKHLK
jgi:hypothetical protein